MSGAVALLVVFNHRFDTNLSRLREHYKERFTNVFFLVPFYDGEDEDVIPVYFSSDNFQGFFTQAYPILKEKDFDHWFVVADDMIINPVLNEGNIIRELGLTTKDSFIPSLSDFNPILVWWHSYKYLSFRLNNPFVQNQEQLPSPEEALVKLKEYSLEPKGLKFSKSYPGNYDRQDMVARYGLRFLADERKQEELLFGDYPLCKGYSDIFCIGKANLERFCHYCGVFAASGLFVEIALPTALLFATKGEIVFQNQISFRGKALWGDEKVTELEAYESSLSRLLKSFPKEYLFLHPVKLSAWKD